MKYKYTADEAKKFDKHGIDLTVYPTEVSSAKVTRVSVQKGHFQEFYDKKSFYIYYVIEGFGTFVLNDEKIEVKATDLMVIPPKTRIHYFGKLEMVLTTSPSFNAENEVHVRFVDESESPF